MLAAPSSLWLLFLLLLLLDSALFFTLFLLHLSLFPEFLLLSLSLLLDLRSLTFFSFLLFLFGLTHDRDRLRFSVLPSRAFFDFLSAHPHLLWSVSHHSIPSLVQQSESTAALYDPLYHEPVLPRWIRPGHVSKGSWMMIQDWRVCRLLRNERSQGKWRCQVPEKGPVPSLPLDSSEEGVVRLRQ